MIYKKSFKNRSFTTVKLMEVFFMPADYVYLLAPWWNPAVEQQAIDRTHRIGQVNKIFAYKMICKNTVEEKILSLQQKKKALAADLIADETGFVKKAYKRRHRMSVQLRA